ncbi:MAG TPA: nuclear transport factor 2 family protein [Terriglobales bacterium]|nr:nuclear transport factor 2 family protein [Terriglobales bacterium]
MKGIIRFALLFLTGIYVSFGFASNPQDPAKDRQAIIVLEQEWLHARDAATLNRILASDFVHVIPVDHFLTKQEHIDWVVQHPEPKDRHTRFDKLNVRLYGNVGIVNGSVIATDDSGKELDRTMFTDVFVFRDGRWQAVNAQENGVRK